MDDYFLKIQSCRVSKLYKAVCQNNFIFTQREVNNGLTEALYFHMPEMMDEKYGKHPYAQGDGGKIKKISIRPLKKTKKTTT